MDIGDIPDPAGPAASSETECSAHEKSDVEREATSNNIRGDTPERGTDNQTNEERTCREPGFVFRDPEFSRQRRQGQSNAL